MCAVCRMPVPCYSNCVSLSLACQPVMYYVYDLFTFLAKLCTQFRDTEQNLFVQIKTYIMSKLYVCSVRCLKCMIRNDNEKVRWRKERDDNEPINMLFT